MSELLGYENYHSNGPEVISGATPQGQTPILLRRLCIAAFCSQSASRCDLHVNGYFAMKVVLIVYIYISQGCHFCWVCLIHCDTLHVYSVVSQIWAIAFKNTRAQHRPQPWEGHAR